MEHSKQHGSHYRKLALMIALMFVAMYVLMYAMVDRFAHVYNSVNQLWMAGQMTAVMVVIELAIMGSMYPNRRTNLGILVVGVVALGFCWFATREQWLVGDRQFLRSMIPHHAGAILMCREAPVSDARIRSLCSEIVASQQREIDAMTALLDEQR